MGLFDKLRDSLGKTRDSLGGAVDNVIRAFTGVDGELFDELEEALILADVGVNTASEITERLRDAAKFKKIIDKDQLRAELREILSDIMKNAGDSAISDITPIVILVIGVNGVGKTTTVGKLANYFTRQNKSVLITAADTFRAAAAEQLSTWAERANVGIIKQQEGSDPAAVVFDAANAARARGTDVLICDTAGRLHNKKNLMDELTKIKKIVERELPGAAKEVLLVLDATTGQNAVIQTREFTKTTDITGIVLTKLDGTAKGGIVIAIANDHNIPVKLVGVGEGIEDLCDFDAETFIDGVLG